MSLGGKEKDMSRKLQVLRYFVCLVILALVSLVAQAAFAQSPPLTFGNNIFVTGDYVVAGAYNMTTSFSNGYAVGTINIPDTNPGITGTTQVPAGAQIVGALLYWETAEKTGQLGSGQNGFFRPLVANGPKAPGYAISGDSITSHNTVSWSSGGCNGTSTGKMLRAYRADVRGLLPQDSNGNVLANGTYEVRLPSVGNSTPITLGASLVIIYRVLSPSVPLKSIVIYDGAFAPSTSSLNMSQTVQGFYQAAQNPVSRLTHIVGSGQRNKYQTVYLDSIALPSLYKNGLPPFPGWYGSWDNPTWTFTNPITNPIHANDASATTSVVPSSSNQGCVSWGAVIVSTTVQNSDQDGLLDAWKATHGYCDASVNEGSCSGPGDPAWVDLTGAATGQKDVFVQLDYMYGPGYSFDPHLAIDPADQKNAVQKVVEAYANNRSNPIQLHVIPGNAIQEPTCTESGSIQCVYPNQPGVVGWPGGFVLLQNELIAPAGNICTPADIGCVAIFQHGKKDSYRYALFAHAVGVPDWTLGSGSLTSVVQSGNKVTFTTAMPHGISGNASDQICSNGRVTVSFATSNPNLNGTFCVQTATPTTFTIQVSNSTAANYTLATDPNLAVVSGQSGTVSGFSDIGGQHSLIGLGSWGPDGQTWPVVSGTFMHELGHANGLTHGRFFFDSLTSTNNNYTPTIESNCKPNDQSVMSYTSQVDLLDTGLLDSLGNPLLKVDYSEQGLPTLNTGVTTPAGVLTSTTTPFYPTTTWYVPWSGVGDPAALHCDGTPLFATDPKMSRFTGPVGALGWTAGQEINFDGNTSEILRGGSEWTTTFKNNGLVLSPGIDLRQMGATGSMSAAGVTGLNGSGVKGLGGGGGLQDLGGGGGLRGLGGGGGLRGLGGGGGLRGLGGGGGLGEITHLTVNSVTRPPRNLVGSEAASPRNITLNWTAPTFGQIGAYKVYRSADGGNTFTVITTVSGAPPVTTYTDTVACNPTGYEYFVTAVLSDTSTNPGQESAGSNTIPASGQSPLTGCYTVPAFSSPASAIQGSIVPITWTLTDDFYSTGNPVNRAAASTLVALGPVSANACGTVTQGRIPLVLSGIAQSGAGTLSSSGNQFTFMWDTDAFCAGSYTFELDLDSTQVLTTTSQLQLKIDVTDTDNPQITTTTLPDATVDVAYSIPLTEDGGVGTLTWSMTSGSLPSGIVFDPATHTLQGTPTVPAANGITFTAQLYHLTVQVSDAAGNVGSQALTLRLITAASFNKTDYATGAGPIGVIAADFNDDGKPDLATANSVDGTVSILLGNGDGTFAAQPTLVTGSVPYSLAAGDFNRDGKLDLVVTNFANGTPSTVSVFIGNGDGTFQAPVTYGVGSGPISVITGDFNGDGFLDVAVANQNDHSVSILLGVRDGTFQPNVDYPAGTPDVGGVTSGDFNHDGVLDLALSNPSNDTVSVLLGNGDGTFQPPVSYATGNSGVHPIAVTQADFNGDGMLDLAVTNLNANTVAILLGNGDGTFQSSKAYPSTRLPSIGPSAMTTGDFNGDGKIDLAITDQHDNTVSILLGNGDGTFQTPLEFTTGTLATGVVAGDFNLDGRLDLAVANLTDNTVSVMLHLPQPPTNLAAAGVTTAQVNLAWTASASTGISGYNVYRATTSGGPYTKLNSTVVTASAFTDTTVVHGTTYYYVVTAVDASSLESVFSNEVSAVP